MVDDYAPIYIDVKSVTIVGGDGGVLSRGGSGLLYSLKVTHSLQDPHDLVY